jgi:23S rRNA (uracil1939-C5)-methyltransferase
MKLKNKAGSDPQSIEAPIEKWVYGGEGLARNGSEVILAPYVLPGELVRMQAALVKPGLRRALAVDVLTPSPYRTVPPCPYFGSCGGCQYQHAPYEYQLQQKEVILRETLRRFAGFEEQIPIEVVSADPWQYRNRIQLHFDAGRTGFRKAGSQELQPIDHCHIASPVLVDAIAKLARAAKQPQWPRFLRSLDLFTNETELQLTVADTTRPIAARFFEWCSTFLPNLVPGEIAYSALDCTFRISRSSFFQVNRFLVDRLVTTALANANGSFAIDLYAGVGLFSIALARSFERVVAVERSGPAVRDLEWNTAQHATNVSAMKAGTEEFLAQLTEAPDLVLADPPRAGLGPKAVADLLRLLPANVILVSCDPATASRDLKQLLARYQMERLALVDLFPQTYHFETVFHLRRRNIASE